MVNDRSDDIDRPLLAENRLPGIHGVRDLVGLDGLWQQTFRCIPSYSPLQSEKSYKPMAAYGQSKLACLLFANRLGDIARERGWPLLSTSAHPGHTRTNLQTSGPNMGSDSTHRSLLFQLLPSMGVEWGTDSLLRAAVDPTATQGAFYGPQFLIIGNSHVAKQPRSAKSADSVCLWQVAEALTGTKPPPVE